MISKESELFGESRKRVKLQKTAIDGVVDIVYLNARQLGYHMAGDKIPRELAFNDSFIGAVAGLTESTCKTLGVPSHEVLCNVIGNLFKIGNTVTTSDIENAMQTIEKSFQSSDAEAAFLDVRDHLDSLAGTEEPAGNKSMLFLVDYMNLGVTVNRVDDSTIATGESSNLGYEESADGCDPWDEYSAVSAVWKNDVDNE